jgi:hypothetical protein
MALDQIHPNAACASSSQLLPQVLRRSLECKLHTAVRVMDQSTRRNGALRQGHLQCRERQFRS